jgi:flagellar assembly protein FliH
MSSKILLREHGCAEVQPIVWRTSGQGGQAAGARQDNSTRFEPSVSIDPETAALRNRLIETEQTARQAVEAARRQGLAEGEAQGRAEASRELEPVLAQLARSLEEVAALRPRLREEAESDVVQLSLAIARRILHRELSLEPEAIQALVQVALERLARQEIYRVHVHPAQEAAIRKALAAHHGAVEVNADPRLAMGALMFETNRGKMDASVAAQFEEIERGLTDRVKHT